MAKLTAEQRRFLLKHKIPLSRVFDASGMRTMDYKEEMKENDMLVAIGVSPCAEAGHTMRLRRGICFQCNPDNLSYHLRFRDKGEVYLAWSKKGHLAKVGTSKSATERIQHLRSYKYGGQDDWRLVLWVRCDEAGRAEFDVHSALSRFEKKGLTYYKNGRYIACDELFDCDVAVAEKAMRRVLEQHTEQMA